MPGCHLELTSQIEKTLIECVMHIVLHVVELINHVIMLMRFPLQSVQHSDETNTSQPDARSSYKKEK